jgi:hypothetical protein
MIVLSNAQADALIQIKQLNEVYPNRPFIQAELNRVTLHSLRALESKGFIESSEPAELWHMYYRYTGKEVVL